MKVRVKKFTGLYTHPNPLSQVPEGALSVADDCSIDKEGIIENRRGFDFYGSTLSSKAAAALKFKNRSIVSYGTNLAYDSDGAGTYSPYSGSFSAITGTKIRGQELNGSLFFTTNNGVYKLDSLTGTPRPAGVPKPLDMVTSFSTNPIGFMNYNSQVAYRMVWSRTDANNISTSSSPSQRSEVVNSLININTITKSGSTATVTASSPHGYLANDLVTITNAESYLNLTALTQTSGVATGTTAAAHGILAGDTVTIRGSNPDAYNGSYIIATVPSTTTFTYNVIGSPVSPATGVIQVGRSPGAYNGTYLVISAPSTTTFTYQIISTPLGNATAVANTTMQVGKPRDIVLSFPVPTGIISGDVFKIYRSEQSVSSSVTSSDKMQLVYTGTYNAGTSVSVTDVTPDSFKGEDLYTNATQQGIAQANDTPPLANDIAAYKNVLFYGNTQTKQAVSFQMLSADGIVRDTDYIVVAGTQYFFSSAESLTDPYKCRLYADITGATLSRTSTTATITTSVNHGLSIGDAVFLSRATDANYNARYIVQTVPSATTFTITVVATANTSDTLKVSTGTPAQNIAATVLSLCKVINRTSANLYAYYTSGPDDIPGSFQVVAQNLSFATFYTTSSVGNNFSPTIPASGTTLPSKNDVIANRLFYSKDKQPDSVPALNYFDIGPRDEKILRIVGLRDSLFIIKENSIWRLAGDDSRNFVISLFDNNAACQGPETVAQLNNTIYMYSSQGVVSVGDGGVAVVSRPIEIDLLPLSSYFSAQTIMHGIGYESERKYLLFFQNLSTDTVPTAAYVYNTFTKAWTKWLKPATCAVVLNDTLYIGNTYSNTILKERKTRDKTDKKDEGAPATITSIDSTGTILNITGYAYSTFVLGVGQLVQQGSLYAKILTVVGSTVTVDRKAGFIVAACKIANPIKMNWKLLPQVADTPDYMKQFREVQAYPVEDTFSQCNLIFASDLAKINKTVPFMYLSREQGFGFSPFGNTPFGDVGNITGATPLRTFVPQGLQRCRGLTVGFSHNIAQENVAILNVGYEYEMNSERTTR